MIFDYNSQLDAQGMPRNLTPAKHQGALALLGYNNLGEQNTWGKVLAANPTGFGAGLRHRVATGLAGGNTTAGNVLADTQDEASAMAWSKFALSLNIAKAAAGGGFGGGAGAGSGFISGAGAGSGAVEGAAENSGVKNFMMDLFGNRGFRNDIENLNNRVLNNNPNVNKGTVNAIGDALSGDIVSSLANSIVTSTNYLKSDDQSLKNYINNNVSYQSGNLQ